MLAFSGLYDTEYVLNTYMFACFHVFAATPIWDHRMPLSTRLIVAMNILEARHHLEIHRFHRHHQH